MSRGLGSMAFKAPSSPEKPILPSACTTWELGYVTGLGKQRKGRTGEISVSGQIGIELDVLEGSMWWSLPAHPPPSTSCALQAPGAPGDHFSLSGFPVGSDLGSQPSLVIWAGIGSKLLKGGNYLGISPQPPVTCPYPAGLWHWLTAPQGRRTGGWLPGCSLVPSFGNHRAKGPRSPMNTPDILNF